MEAILISEWHLTSVDNCTNIFQVFKMIHVGLMSRYWASYAWRCDQGIVQCLWVLDFVSMQQWSLEPAVTPTLSLQRSAARRLSLHSLTIHWHWLSPHTNIFRDRIHFNLHEISVFRISGILGSGMRQWLSCEALRASGHFKWYEDSFLFIWAQRYPHILLWREKWNMFPWVYLLILRTEGERVHRK